jgi:hypothetical protein
VKDSFERTAKKDGFERTAKKGGFERTPVTRRLRLSKYVRKAVFKLQTKYKFYEINYFVYDPLISWFLYGPAEQEIKKSTRQCPFSFFSKSH